MKTRAFNYNIIMGIMNTATRLTGTTSCNDKLTYQRTVYTTVLWFSSYSTGYIHKSTTHCLSGLLEYASKV